MLVCGRIGVVTDCSEVAISHDRRRRWGSTQARRTFAHLVQSLGVMLWGQIAVEDVARGRTGDRRSGGRRWIMQHLHNSGTITRLDVRVKVPRSMIDAGECRSSLTA